jgi:hypothetical protein
MQSTSLRKLVNEQNSQIAAQERAITNNTKLSQSLESLAQRYGVVAEQAELFGKAQAKANQEAWDFTNSMKSVAGTFADSYSWFMQYQRALDENSRKAAAAVNAYNSSMATFEARNSSAAQGVGALELRLLELTGTEEQIANARAQRDKAQIQMEIEKTKLAMQRAQIEGDEDSAKKYQTEIELLNKQIGLLNRIQQAEARQKKQEKASSTTAADAMTITTSKPAATTAAVATPIQTKPAVETVKTVKIELGQGLSINVLPGQEAVVERVIKDLATGRARA